MNFIFYGFLLNVFGSFTVGGVNIGPLLSVGGYFLIHKGVMSLDRENPYFKKVPTLLYALMILSGLVFIIGLVDTQGFGGFIGIAAFVIDIIVIYNIIKGIQLYSDKLIDQTQPKKLFKRWRIQYILIGVIVALSFVLLIAAIASVSWTAISGFITEFSAVGATDTDALQAIFTSYLSVLQPILVILLVWVISVFFISISLVVFKIMFLVSMFRIQSDYQIYLNNKTIESLTQNQ